MKNNLNPKKPLNSYNHDEFIEEKKKNGYQVVKTHQSIDDSKTFFVNFNKSEHLTNKVTFISKSELYKNWVLVDWATEGIYNEIIIKWKIFYSTIDKLEDTIWADGKIIKWKYLHRIKNEWKELFSLKSDSLDIGPMIEKFTIGKDLTTFVCIEKDNKWLSNKNSYYVHFKWEKFILENNKDLKFRELSLTDNCEHFLTSWMDEDSNRDDCRTVFITDKLSKKECNYLYWWWFHQLENWKLIWVNMPNWYGKYLLDSHVITFNWEEIYEYYEKEFDDNNNTIENPNKPRNELKHHNLLWEVYFVWNIPDDLNYMVWNLTPELFSTYVAMDWTLFQEVSENEFRFKKQNNTENTWYSTIAGWQKVKFIDDKYIEINNKKYLKSIVKFGF